MLKLGDITYGQIPDIYPPKKKYCVCVCAKHKYFFLINTENREMYDCIPIPKGKTFPEYDGFISCSRVFSIKSRKVVDRVSDDTLKSILEKVKISKKLLPKQINTIVSENFWNFILKVDPQGFYFMIFGLRIHTIKTGAPHII